MIYSVFLLGTRGPRQIARAPTKRPRVLIYHDTSPSHQYKMIGRSEVMRMSIKNHINIHVLPQIYHIDNDVRTVGLAHDISQLKHNSFLAMTVILFCRFVAIISGHNAKRLSTTDGTAH